MSTAATSAITRTNPFPGLRPFQEDEEYLFFGRESQVDDMVNTLAATHFLAVVGGSGSGKSSLVNCGLRPALRRGFMAQAGTVWRMAQFRPGSDPLGALTRALASDGVLFRGYEATGGLTLTELIDTTLRMSKLGLIDLYEQARLGEGVNLLVVVDQFEELFRYRQLGTSQQEKTYGATAEATAFMNLLLEIREQTTYPIYVVLTMRSDFLGDCAQFPGLPEAINAGQYLVPRLTRDERREAISGPVGVGGAEITPVLLTRLVNDVGDNPDQLSILQHALNRTWDDWQREGSNGPVELRHYDAIGTMAHALDQHAENAYAELGTGQRQQICEKLFKALTDKATDPRGVRRPTTLDTLCALTTATAAEVTEVIDIFREPSRSFVMPPAGEALTPNTVIDISHESLMRVWERLKTWADEEAQSARLYRRLAETAVLHATGKASLWRDPDLQLALDWREKEQPTAVWAARYAEGFEQAMDFLRASVTRRDEEAREQETQRQRALEQTQALAFAKEQQQRAEEQARVARRLFWLSGGLLVMLLFAVGSLVFAWRKHVAAEFALGEETEAVDAAREALEAAAAKATVSAPQATPETESRFAQAQTAFANASRQSTDVPDSSGLIYIQMRPHLPLEQVQQIRQKLQEQQFAVPDVELLEVGPATTTEVRYFRRGEEEGANRIRDILQSVGVQHVTTKYISGYEDSPKIKPKQYEIWFAANAFT